MMNNEIPDYKITAAGCLVVTSDKKILAFQRTKSQQKLGLPAGKRNIDEPLHTCAEREVLEETGIVISLSGKEKVFVYKPDDKQEEGKEEYCATFIVFLASEAEQNIIGLSNEYDDGTLEGQGIWVDADSFLAQGNSAFLDYNTHLLRFAGLL